MATPSSMASAVRSQSRRRAVLVASADASFRHRISSVLSGLRWQVLEAGGGAEAWGKATDAPPQVMIVDSWLPDLDRDEFLRDFHASFPDVDVVTAGDMGQPESRPGPHRGEILYALRQCQDCDTAAWNRAPILVEDRGASAVFVPTRPMSNTEALIGRNPIPTDNAEHKSGLAEATRSQFVTTGEAIPELIGNSEIMLELGRRIRRVAPRNTPVLIEGPTGSGKELVAAALHRLSARHRKPLVAINCAAIPEALLEAELFGHTRGAFTGAVQRRIGRIEAANGGTLFLDEIGDMPLAVQSKLLRFVESGELQRVGENVPVKVDVRIVAATLQPLASDTHKGCFRADLYYRLAVFLIRTPALAEHIEDLPLLANHFLDRLSHPLPMKAITNEAMAKLMAHPWPGNVRELEHVLERATILAEDDPLLKPEHIELGDLVH